MVQGQPRQIVCETSFSKITRAKWTGGVTQLVEALSSNPVPQEKKKRRFAGFKIPLGDKIGRLRGNKQDYLWVWFCYCCFPNERMKFSFHTVLPCRKGKQMISFRGSFSGKSGGLETQ
jgi:hypothetical protein